MDIIHITHITTTTTTNPLILILMEEAGGVELWITVLVEVVEVGVIIWEWLGMEWATVRASAEVIHDLGRGLEERDLVKTLGKT